MARAEDRGSGPSACFPPTQRPRIQPPETPVAPSSPQPESDRPGAAQVRSSGRRRLGQVLIGCGLLLIFGAVIYVLEVANGPGTGPKHFAERRSYNQVKVALHESFPLGFAIALVGLGTAYCGKRLLGAGGPGAGAERGGPGGGRRG